MHLEFAVAAFQFLWSSLKFVYRWYRWIVLLRFPYAAVIASSSNAINSATNVYAANAGKPPMYWLHSLVLVMLGTMGGGSIGLVMIGKPAAMYCNDIAVAAVLGAWFATQCLPLQAFLTRREVKVVWNFILGLFRSHSISNFVTLANSVLPDSPFSSNALLGPIIAGTVAGTMGPFLPFDKGLSALQNGTPWVTQGAFFTATFYHLMINDKGVLGTNCRRLFGTLDREDVVFIIGTVQGLCLAGQALFSPHFNIFAPIHKVLYWILPFQGPAKTPEWPLDSKRRFFRVVETLRLLAVALAVVFVAGKLTAPVVLLSSAPAHATTSPVSLVDPAFLWVDLRALSTASGHASSLSTCELLGDLRGCQRHRLEFESLALSPSDGPAALGAPTASANASANATVVHRLALYDSQSHLTRAWSLSDADFEVEAAVCPHTQYADLFGHSTCPSRRPAVRLGAAAAASYSLWVDAQGRWTIVRTAACKPGGLACAREVVWRSQTARCAPPEALTGPLAALGLGNTLAVYLDPRDGHPTLACPDRTLVRL